MISTLNLDHVLAFVQSYRLSVQMLLQRAASFSACVYKRCIHRFPSPAALWVNKNVTACIPSTNIAAIAVGSEVLNTTPHVSPVLASALSNIHKALVVSNLNFEVKVSSPMSMDIMPKPFPPPSTSTFSPSWSTTVC
ncbi:hypothetical protein Bca101_060377 [Brassica carinata]